MSAGHWIDTRTGERIYTVWTYRKLPLPPGAYRAQPDMSQEPLYGTVEKTMFAQTSDGRTDPRRWVPARWVQAGPGRPATPQDEKRRKRGLMQSDAEMRSLDALAAAWDCSRNDAISRAVSRALASVPGQT